MSESDIAKLCRKIYKQHRQAIELIYEHRLDIRSDIEEYVGKIIQEFASAENSNIEKDDSNQTYIRFSPKEWDSLSFQKDCYGWTKSKRILLFEFRNFPQRLELNLVIGPGSVETKSNIYKLIKNLKISGIRKCIIKKESTWNHICSVPILTPSDYDDENLEDLQEKIRSVWSNFISNDGDLEKIRKAIYDSFKS